MKAIFYFTAQWCSPCKQTLPMVENFIKENENLGLIVIDIETEEELVKSFQIQQVPTIILFENDEYVKTTTGSITKEELREFIYG